MLPLRPTIGKQKQEETEQAYFNYHGMLMVEKPAGMTGRPIVDISCF
jgi:hypothetical protein